MKHDISLRKIKSSNYKTSINSVLELLAGKKISSKAVCEAQPYSKENNSKSRSKLELFYPIRAVECSAQILGQNLIANLDDLQHFGLPVETE